MAKIWSIDENEEIIIKVLNNEVGLDYPCWKCTDYGKPSYPKGPRQIYSINEGHEKCSRCDNKRFVLTDAGEAIMALVQRHGGK